MTDRDKKLAHIEQLLAAHKRQNTRYMPPWALVLSSIIAGVILFGCAMLSK